uniref:Uncharacterized protein n=1 Tax=Rhizophora mucronata TaxID=61149 RepID=A0A2P2IN79_RHIMU
MVHSPQILFFQLLLQGTVSPFLSLHPISLGIHLHA